MATWEDGPEYAPVQRPDHFAGAPVPPLEIVPPVLQPAAGAPADRPGFDDPSAPVAPLAALIPPVENPRDPQLPFDVASSTMTEESSAWSAAHWTPPPADAAGAGPWGPPVGTPWNGSPNAWPAPDPAATAYAPLTPRGAPPPAYGEFAAPGTTQWFAPPPPPGAPTPPQPVTFAQVLSASSPGALICLVVGGLVSPLSPVTLWVAFGLSSRITAARAWVRRTFGIALGLFSLIGLIILVSSDYTFSEWWLVLARWGQLFSWILVVVVPLVVRQGLIGRLGGGPQPDRWN